MNELLVNFAPHDNHRASGAVAERAVVAPMTEVIIGERRVGIETKKFASGRDFMVFYPVPHNGEKPQVAWMSVEPGEVISSVKFPDALTDSPWFQTRFPGVNPNPHEAILMGVPPTDSGSSIRMIDPKDNDLTLNSPKAKPYDPLEKTDLPQKASDVAYDKAAVKAAIQPDIQFQITMARAGEPSQAIEMKTAEGSFFALEVTDEMSQKTPVVGGRQNNGRKGGNTTSQEKRLLEPGSILIFTTDDEGMPTFYSPRLGKAQGTFFSEWKLGDSENTMKAAIDQSTSTVRDSHRVRPRIQQHLVNRLIEGNTWIFPEKPPHMRVKNSSTILAERTAAHTERIARFDTDNRTLENHLMFKWLPEEIDRLITEFSERGDVPIDDLPEAMIEEIVNHNMSTADRARIVAAYDATANIGEHISSLSRTAMLTHLGKFDEGGEDLHARNFRVIKELINQDPTVADSFRRMGEETFQALPPDQQERIVKDIQGFKEAKRRQAEQEEPSVADLGHVHVRRDIVSSIEKFHYFPDHKVEYPQAVVDALGDIYGEYNNAFKALVEANREWPEDYQYAFDDDGNPVNFFVQIDMVGLRPDFMEAAAGMDPEELKKALRGKIFEIENSLAMYGLLMNLFAKDGNMSAFERGFRESLDELRERHGKKVALLAVTPAKHEAMRASEFGKKPGEELTDEEVMALSGFDRLFGPDEFEEYLKQNGGECDYLLYARTSDPSDKLKDPTLKVEIPLLENDKTRRVIKANAITFNVDNPTLSPGDPGRINDTKGYLREMGLGYEISSYEDLARPEFHDYLRSQGIDPQDVASGAVLLRAKPAQGFYGCYGHETGRPNSEFKGKLNARFAAGIGNYVIQPEMPVTRVTNVTDGNTYDVIHRNFMAFTNGNPKFMSGFGSYLDSRSQEAQNRRNHGSKDTNWVEIVKI